jgi:hypothetical protein
MIVCLRFKRVRLLLHRYVLPALCALTIGLGGCTAAIAPNAQSTTDTPPGDGSSHVAEPTCPQGEHPQQGEYPQPCDKSEAVINPQSQCCAVNQPQCGGNSYTCGQNPSPMCKLSCWVAVPLIVLILPLAAL